MKTAQIQMKQYDAWSRYRSMIRQPPNFANQKPELRRRLLAENEAAKRIYRRIGEGRQVINLQETFQLAGVDEHGWPKLAIERADYRFTWCRAWTSTMVAFGQIDEWSWEKRASIKVLLPQHRLMVANAPRSLRAVVPTIPLEHMPKGQLERYHILWEAEWTPTAPKDPILLQHLAADAWLVLAQWDLTEVERLVLAGRFSP